MGIVPATGMPMPVNVLMHPLAQVLVTELRDKCVPPHQFRNLCARLTMMLAMEAIKDIPLIQTVVDTPLETCAGVNLAQDVVIVPVLRAGLGMVDPILTMLPNAQVGHIGIERDHDTALPRSYYSKLPALEGKRVLIVDPMLATGGSLLHAVAKVRTAGGTDIVVVCIIAAPEGIAALEMIEPEVAIHTAALDRCLNDMKYILPGVGDFGDRLMGT